MTDLRTLHRQIDSAEQKKIIERLSEPFDPSEIYWKPQATNAGKTQAIAAAYADPRAYSDRLNEIVGPGGWACSYVVTVIPPLPAGQVEQGSYSKLAFAGKVLVVAELTINGVGVNSGTGEAWADDDNAMTAAEAQAFKRAAIRFGLGRYLYDLPKGVWCAYDSKTRKFTKTPELPEWAVPKRLCDEPTCRQHIVPFQHGDRLISITEIIANGQRKYKKQLCAKCQQSLAAHLETTTGQVRASGVGTK